MSPAYSSNNDLSYVIKLLELTKCNDAYLRILTFQRMERTFSIPNIPYFHWTFIGTFGTRAYEGSREIKQ